MIRTDDSVVAAVRRECGDAVVAALIDRFGGERIHIPLKAHDRGRLGAALSSEHIAALVRAIGGETIDVPLGGRSLERRRLATVKAMLREGAKINEIVRQAPASRRYVFKIKAQMRAELRAAREAAAA